MKTCRLREVALIFLCALQALALSSCTGIYLSKPEIVRILKERESSTCRPCNYSASVKGSAHVNGIPLPMLPVKGGVHFGDDGVLHGAVSAFGHGGLFSLDSVRISYDALGEVVKDKLLKIKLNEFIQDALVNQIPKLYELYGDTSFAHFNIAKGRHMVHLWKTGSAVRLHFDGDFRLHYFVVRKGNYDFRLEATRYKHIDGGDYFLPVRFKVRVRGKDYSFRLRVRLKEVDVEQHTANYVVESIDM